MDIGTFKPSVPIRLRRKKKSFNATWSDEESKGSQEDDDHVSNYVAFNVYSNQSDFADSVTNGAADGVTTTAVTEPIIKEKDEVNSELDYSSDGEELTEDAI